MTLSQRAVEAAAEKMEAKRVELQHLPLARIYNELAQAAITAALAVDGLCLVPKEPTQEMLDAALAMDAVSHGVLVPAGPADVWAAMIAAASDGDSPRQTEG